MQTTFTPAAINSEGEVAIILSAPLPRRPFMATIGANDVLSVLGTSLPLEDVVAHQVRQVRKILVVTMDGERLVDEYEMLVSPA